MNDQERLMGKNKFRTLVLLLDLVILTAAVGIIFLILGFFKPIAPEVRITVIVVCTVVSVGTLSLFLRTYRATKAWLTVHGTTKAERIAETKAKEDTERARIRAELLAEIGAEQNSERKEH